MQVTIRGDNVVLQPVSGDLARAIVDGDLDGIAAGPGWPHEDTVDAMRMTGELQAGAGWVVEVGGLIVGDCGTLGDVDGAGTVEIGYGLSAAYRGRGLGTEVIRVLSNWLLSDGGADTVTATVEPTNPASLRALARAGFVRVDDRSDGVVYQLSRRT